MKLTIIIPAYNEEKVIEKVISSLPRQLPGIDHISTILVDDGSTDKTLEKAKKQGIYTIHHGVNRGQGAAVQTGINAAKHLNSDIIVTIDGDDQHNGEDIEHLIEPIMKNEADIVNGSRFLKKQKIPIIRRFYNFGGNTITWLISGYFLTDSQSGMRALSRKAADKITIKANGYEFCSEMVREARWHRFKLKEVPIHVSYSQYSLQKGQNFAMGLKTIFKLVIRSLMK